MTQRNIDPTKKWKQPRYFDAGAGSNPDCYRVIFNDLQIQNGYRQDWKPIGIIINNVLLDGNSVGKYSRLYFNPLT
jgi:hypothetical protein